MKRIDLKTKQDKENKSKAEITITGEITLQYIEDIIEDVRAVVKKFTDFRFVFKNIDGFDLSAIQMIYSIKKSCDEENKKVIFDINLPEDLEQVVINAGFVDVLNSFDADKI